MPNVSVKQMYDYLKLATLMETDYHSCEQLMSKILQRANQLNSTDYYTEQEYLLDIARDPVKIKGEKLMPWWLKAYLIMIPICLISALFAGIKTFILAAAVYVGVFAIAFGITASKKKNKENAAKQRHIEYDNRFQESNRLKEKNEAIVDNYSVQFEEAKKAKAVAYNNLQKLYSENILPVKYRNYTAVATMFQWLRDGRCTQIYGHGGLFDTYEYDLRIGQIISNLEDINRKMDIVINNQGVLYSEIRRGNEIAEKTYQSVCRIEQNSEEVLKNTDKIKRNTDIIAMETAYQTRFQEYAYYRSLYY